jgi:hypothetical protein
MQVQLQRYSYRFADEVLNSVLPLKREIELVLTESLDLATLSRPAFNALLRKRFIARGWADQPQVFGVGEEAGAKMDFLKDRIGIEVGFGHASFIGIDLLKFQVSSYSALDKIDVGVYIVTTNRFKKFMYSSHQQKWEGSLSFEKVKLYLPHFKSAIQVPIYVLGIDVAQ